MALTKASCLTMQVACEGNGFEDTHHILTFLNHYFELVTGHSQNHDKPIENAFCALVHTSSTLIGEALEEFDPTQPSFIHGICQHTIFKASNFGF